jgi:hypothetical protein
MQEYEIEEKRMSRIYLERVSTTAGFLQNATVEFDDAAGEPDLSGPLPNATVARRR